MSGSVSSVLETWWSPRVADGPLPGAGDVAAGLQRQAAPLVLSHTLTARPGPGELGAAELVDHIEGYGRVIAHLQARQGAATAELLARCEAAPVDPRANPFTRDPMRDASSQVALALRLSPRGAEHAVDDALLLQHWPATAAAMSAGRIDLATARAIGEEAGLVGAEHRAVLEAAALAQAGEGAPARAVRMFTRRVALKLDPAAAAERAQAARGQRRLTKTPVVDDMAAITADLTAEEVKDCWDALTRRAEALPATDADGNPLCLDERRATVFVDLITHPEKVRDCTHRDSGDWQSDVVVAATTIDGQDDAPGELVGHGPITAATARRLAQKATWRRLDVDPATAEVTGAGARRHRPAAPQGPDDGDVVLAGRLSDLIADGIASHVVHRSTSGYRPTMAIGRYVQAVHVHCRFLGCRRPSADCDLDHATAYAAGGRTCICNLIPLCRFHHRVKHLTGWHIQIHPDRSVTWTTPAGHHYRAPPPTLRE